VLQVGSARIQQRLKIEEIGTTLAECGFVALDEQAYVLGLSRSTAWTVLRAMHKNSGLSATTINRMLDTGRLPPRVRLKLLEYIAEKMSGAYGDREHSLKAFASRISPVHMHAASADVHKGTSKNSRSTTALCESVARRHDSGGADGSARVLRYGEAVGGVVCEG